MLFKGQGNLAGVELRETEKAIYYKVRVLDEDGKVFEGGCTKEIHDFAKSLPRFERVSLNIEIVQGKYEFIKVLELKQVKPSAFVNENK